MKPRTVHDSGKNLAHVELGLPVLGDDPVKFLGIVIGLLMHRRFDDGFWHTLPLTDNLARQCKGVLFCGGAIISRPRDRGVHHRAAKLLHADLFAGGRLDQWRTAQEDRPGALDDDVVIAQRRHIGAARGAMPANDGNLRDIGLAQLDLVAKHPPAQIAVGKHAVLQRQEAPGAIADMDDRQTVFQCDIQKPHDLFNGMGIPRPALDARIVGVDGHLAALHDADAGHHGGTGHGAIIFAAGGQRREFKERRARIEQQLQPLAHAQFVLACQAVDVPLGPLETRRMLAGVKLLQPFGHGGEIGLVVGGIGVDMAFDPAHCQSSCGVSWARTAFRPKLSPAVKGISATTPSRGAVRVVSSFMLSMTRSGWPSVTVSPGLTATETTTPGIGANSRSPPAAPSLPASRSSGSTLPTSKVRPFKCMKVDSDPTASRNSCARPPVRSTCAPGAPVGSSWQGTAPSGMFRTKRLPSWVSQHSASWPAIMNILRISFSTRPSCGAFRVSASRRSPDVDQTGPPPP